MKWPDFDTRTVLAPPSGLPRWQPQADPEAARRAGAAVQAFAEAMLPAPALRHWEFAALAGTPRMRGLSDAERRRRAMKSEYRRRRR